MTEVIVLPGFLTFRELGPGMPEGPVKDPVARGVSQDHSHDSGNWLHGSRKIVKYRITENGQVGTVIGFANPLCGPSCVTSQDLNIRSVTQHAHKINVRTSMHCHRWW